MRERQLLNAVIDLVPQWYKADFDPNRYTISIGEVTETFYSQRTLTPQLLQLLDFAHQNLSTWLSQLPHQPTPSSIEQVKQELVLRWLTLEDSSVKWNKLLAYIENLRYRTFENQPVVLNLVISNAQGSFDITESALQKFLDPLAVSRQVFLRVNKNLKFIGYEEVLWSSITDSRDYKLYPEFLQPVASAMQPGEFSVHLTQRGDFIIMAFYGLVASWRKGQWYIYDAPTFKNNLGDIIGHYGIACKNKGVQNLCRH